MSAMIASRFLALTFLFSKEVHHVALMKGEKYMYILVSGWIPLKPVCMYICPEALNEFSDFNMV